MQYGEHPASEFNYHHFIPTYDGKLMNPSANSVTVGWDDHIDLGLESPAGPNFTGSQQHNSLEGHLYGGLFQIQETHT